MCVLQKHYTKLDLRLSKLKEATREVLAAMPVYISEAMNDKLSAVVMKDGLFKVVEAIAAGKSQSLGPDGTPVEVLDVGIS